MTTWQSCANSGSNESASGTPNFERLKRVSMFSCHASDSSSFGLSEEIARATLLSGASPGADGSRQPPKLVRARLEAGQKPRSDEGRFPASRAADYGDEFAPRDKRLHGVDGFSPAEEESPIGIVEWAQTYKRAGCARRGVSDEHF